MTHYAKPFIYLPGDYFPFLVDKHIRFQECDETLYECWKPECIEDEEFNLVIVLHGNVVRARSIHFDFINQE